MNVLNELLITLDDASILCANVDIKFSDRTKITLELPIGYQQQELETFLSQLDFELDDDIDCIYEDFYGTVWISEGDWIDRVDEGYGPEWVRFTAPQIPKRLLKSNQL